MNDTNITPPLKERLIKLLQIELRKLNQDGGPSAACTVLLAMVHHFNNIDREPTEAEVKEWLSASEHPFFALVFSKVELLKDVRERDKLIWTLFSNQYKETIECMQPASRQQYHSQRTDFILKHPLQAASLTGMADQMTSFTIFG